MSWNFAEKLNREVTYGENRSSDRMQCKCLIKHRKDPNISAVGYGDNQVEAFEAASMSYDISWEKVRGFPSNVAALTAMSYPATL